MGLVAFADDDLAIAVVPLLLEPDREHRRLDPVEHLHRLGQIEEWQALRLKEQVEIRTSGGRAGVFGADDADALAGPVACVNLHRLQAPDRPDQARSRRGSQTAIGRYDVGSVGQQRLEVLGRSSAQAARPAVRRAVEADRLAVDAGAFSRAASR